MTATDINLVEQVQGILPVGHGGTGNATLAGAGIATLTATQTLTATRLSPRVATISSSATPTLNTDTCDLALMITLGAAVTSMTTNLSGTPTDGQLLMIRIKDNGTARAITWGASFQSSGVATLLASTVISKTHHVGLVWDAAVSKWTCLACDSAGY